MSSYNGWYNKETWLVNVWLGGYFTELPEESGIVIDADFVEQYSMLKYNNEFI